MPKTVKYIGTARNWPELAITGKQSVWYPGQCEQRSDVEAGQLLATGLFADQDARELDENERVALSALVSEAWMSGAILALIGAGPTRVYLDSTPLWLDLQPVSI